MNRRYARVPPMTTSKGGQCHPRPCEKTVVPLRGERVLQRLADAGKDKLRLSDLLECQLAQHHQRHPLAGLRAGAV